MRILAGDGRRRFLVAFDDGTSGRAYLADLERPRRPRPLGAVVQDRTGNRKKDGERETIALVMRESLTFCGGALQRNDKKVKNAMSGQHYGDWVYISEEDDFSGERLDRAVSYGDNVCLGSAQK